MAHDEAYYEAEKKIEEALKSGTTKLDLGLPELGFPAAPEGRPDPIIWGSLVAVMNKHQEFFWVHEKFASEY